MAIDKKLVIPVSLLAVVLLGGAYAFLSLTITTTVNIGEPLSIVSVVGTGDLTGLDCSVTALAATCSIDALAGETGGINVMVHNAGQQALTVTPAGDSPNTDVAITVPGFGTIPSGGSVTFSYGIDISDSASPGTATLTLTFSR